MDTIHIYIYRFQFPPSLFPLFILMLMIFCGKREGNKKLSNYLAIAKYKICKIPFSLCVCVYVYNQFISYCVIQFVYI